MWSPGFDKDTSDEERVACAAGGPVGGAPGLPSTQMHLRGTVGLNGSYNQKVSRRKLGEGVHGLGVSGVSKDKDGTDHKERNW